jgi:hypothetical protein
MKQMDKIKELINSIIDNNPAYAQETFSDIIFDKVNERLPSLRQEIANSVFSADYNNEDEDEDCEFEDEDEVTEEDEEE